jgi:FkbM family methyltransferase
MVISESILNLSNPVWNSYNVSSPDNIENNTHTIPTAVILLIIPDIKSENCINRWNDNVKWAEDNYNRYPNNDDIADIGKRWAIGYIAWKNLIRYNTFIENIKVYFIRTDSRIKDTPVLIKDNIINIYFDNNHGHIIYKTLIAYKLLKSKYDFFIRGNINTIIDIYTINKLFISLPKYSVFTSPFWEGGSYPFGYFMLISNDIACYLTEIDLNHNSRWFLESTADDYELSNIILKKYDYFNLDGCDLPWKSVNNKKPEISIKNKYGIRFVDTESIESIKEQISQSDSSIFVYRIRNNSDKKYISIYIYLLKHIWNKYVKDKYSNITIYEQDGHKVPHLDYERDEQLLAAQYIKPNDVVLELGARYGSVSIIVNKILNNKTNQVSVEPDNTVWNVLERNRHDNNCNFHIYKGIVSKTKYDLTLNGYGSTIDITNNLPNREKINIDNITLEKLEEEYSLKFNVLIADCEGFLEIFLNENQHLYEQLDLIIFERDREDVCNYNNIVKTLLDNNFIMIENNFQSVYAKKIRV